MMQQYKILSLLALVALAGCGQSSSVSGIEGVWQVTRIERVTADASTVISDPQPSLAIFTPNHYSLTWIPAESAMREFQEPWTPTDAEIIRRYGEIIVNSGTYTRTNGALTLMPVVSRVPEFMGGGWLIYEYQVDGDELSLTSIDEYSYEGVQAPWATSGERVTLTLQRADASTH